MNFDGYQKLDIDRYSSQVEQDDPTAIPLGVSPNARNCRFHLNSVDTRYGIQSRYGFTLPSKRPVTGLGCLKLGATQSGKSVQVPISGITVADNFNRANGAITGSLKWATFTHNTVFKESNVISNNQLIAVPWVSQSRGNYWNQLLGPNQFASIRAVSATADSLVSFGVCVMMDAYGENGYFVDVHYGSITWGKYVAGARNIRGNTSSGNLGDNAILGLKITRNDNGSATIMVLKNGQEYNYSPGTGASSTWTDAAPFTTGYIGCYMLNGMGNAASVLMDDFTGGVPDSIGYVTQQVVSPERQVPIAFDDQANLYEESPVGSGVLNQLSGAQVTLPAAAAMQLVSAYNKGYLAFTDLKKAMGQAAVYNPITGKLDPLSMRLVGDLWKAGTHYQVGEVICPAAPVGGNGHMYRCLVPGISGAVQPEFPTVQGAIVYDSTVVWQEMTPTMSLSANPGDIDYGQRYMVTLFVNRNGYISGMTQSSIVSFNAPQPVTTTTGYDTNVVALIGNVTAYWWGDSPHSGPTGNYIWKNPADSGTGTSRTVSTAVGLKQGSSLIFDSAPGAQETPVKWTQFDANGLMSGTVDLFSDPLEKEGFSDFNVIVAASLYVPAAGTYTFQCKHKDGVMLGIGGDGATWAGKGTIKGPNNQTMTVAGGYALLPVTNAGGDAGQIATDNIDVTFNAPGIYPIEANWVYWYHSGRTLTITCAPKGSPQANIVPTTQVTTSTSSSEFQLQVDNIPTGPENTVARICAFTPAGQLNDTAGTGVSKAGPYFWIPPNEQYLTNGFDLSSVPGGVTVADVVDGKTIHSTLIADNTTTSATFNFYDDYLRLTLNDVSSYFRKIQIPPVVDMFFAKSLKRMIYAVDSLQSGWLVSLEDDPETVFGDTGIVQCAENNSENRVAAREFSGVTYLLKERSGHVLSASAEDPSKWKPVEQWSGSGPCGPRAVDVCTEFMCYVHRSGVYIFKSGQPERISKELPISWKSINWGYAHTIAVKIDDDSKEIHIAVPTGKSTVPNKILKCNYEESPDFRSPLTEARDGSRMASTMCYKWSVDDIAANLVVRAERPLQNPPDWMDAATTQSQLLYASSNPDGQVCALIPDVYNDNGLGIDWVYDTACPEKAMIPVQVGGVKANVDGSGEIWIEILAGRAPSNPKFLPPNAKLKAGGESVIPLIKPCQAGIPFYHGARGQNEFLRLRFSNRKQPDVWGSIKDASLYVRPIASGRAK